MSSVATDSDCNKAHYNNLHASPAVLSEAGIVLLLSVCLSVFLSICPRQKKTKKTADQKSMKLARHVCYEWRILETIRFWWPLTSTFDLESYFYISAQSDTSSVRNIDPPRSKHCEGKSLSRREGVATCSLCSHGTRINYLRQEGCFIRRLFVCLFVTLSVCLWRTAHNSNLHQT